MCHIQAEFWGSLFFLLCDRISNTDNMHFPTLWQSILFLKNLSGMWVTLIMTMNIILKSSWLSLIKSILILKLSTLKQALYFWHFYFQLSTFSTQYQIIKMPWYWKLFQVLCVLISGFSKRLWRPSKCCSDRSKWYCSGPNHKHCRTRWRALRWDWQCSQNA